MPELPDVEATRLSLISQGIVGRTIAGVELLWPRAIRTPSQAKFTSGVSGRRIAELRRRGKYLALRLAGNSDGSIILHLGMTGSLQILHTGRTRPRYTRNVLLMDGARELCFVDPRKFSSMWLVGDESEVLSGLGPEPLDPEFTVGELSQRLLGRAAPVKALLCDQAVVAGIGNIYADEVLFLARLHPLKRGRELSSREIGRLRAAIVRRLAEATERLAPLAAGGGPPTDSEEGRDTLLVPRSEGAPCTHCGTALERAVVRGRSTYFCAQCQPA